MDYDQKPSLSIYIYPSRSLKSILNVKKRWYLKRQRKLGTWALSNKLKMRFLMEWWERKSLTIQDIWFQTWKGCNSLWWCLWSWWIQSSQDQTYIYIKKIIFNVLINQPNIINKLINTYVSHFHLNEILTRIDLESEFRLMFSGRSNLPRTYFVDAKFHKSIWSKIISWLGLCFVHPPQLASSFCEFGSMLKGKRRRVVTHLIWLMFCTWTRVWSTREVIPCSLNVDLGY